jgi:hypothetical protein
MKGMEAERTIARRQCSFPGARLAAKHTKFSKITYLKLRDLRVLLRKYLRKSKNKESSDGVRHTGESRYPGWDGDGFRPTPE